MSETMIGDRNLPTGLQLSVVRKNLNVVADGGRRKLSVVTDGTPEKGRRYSTFSHIERAEGSVKVTWFKGSAHVSDTANRAK